MCAAWLSAVMVAHGAACLSLSINAVDSGWYDAAGNHIPENDNYYCGDGVGSAPLRNWFVFNIPTLTQSVASASLQINTFYLNLPDNTETYELRHVATPVLNLRAGGTGLTGIYDDLGDGPIFGSRTFLIQDAYQYVTISLNSNFLSRLTASAGGALAVGGQLVSLDGESGNSENLFGSSTLGPPTNRFVQLILNYSNASPPAIIESPRSFTVLQGDPAAFQVQACGGGPLSYQWQRSGTNIPGATDPFLQLLNVQPQDAGLYRALVTSSLTTATSAVATLTVSNALVPSGAIYLAVGNSPTLAGSAVSFCSSIFGIPSPSYQWQLNETNLPSEQAACLNLSNVQTNQSGRYRLIAHNSAGSFTSAPISLIVTQATPTASIYVANGSVTPWAGSSATLCSTISGGPTPSLQWQFNGANLAGQISGCLYLSNLRSNDSGSYRLVASNAVGAFTSAPIVVAVQYFAPTGYVYIAAGGSLAPAGSQVTFCSITFAGPPAAFQWQFNGTNLPGEIFSCLTLPTVSSNQAGSYRFIATNSVGAFTSAPIALAVSAYPPTGNVYLAGGQLPPSAGSSVTLCSSINAAPPPTYQWQLNGTNLLNQVGSCLYLSNVQSNQDGSYRLIASNPFGSLTSAPIALAVSYFAPTGFISPHGILSPIPAGFSLSISSTISGGPPPSYQWQFNGADLPGQNNTYLALYNLQPNQSGSYRVIATNYLGAFTSEVAVISVVYTPPSASIYLSGGHTPTTIGNNLTLCAAVSGAPAPGVQWQFNGTNLVGQTSSCLYLSNLQTNQSGSYTVVASNIMGMVTSAVAVVRVLEPLPVLAYFTSYLPPFVVGGTAFLCAEVSLPEPPTLQWQHNGTNILDATNFCLYLYPLTTNEAGDYTIVATTPASGAYTSPPIALTVYYAPPTQATPVIISGSASALVGDDVTMVASYGGSPCFIQWRFNGIDLPGQTNGTLALLSLSTNQAGDYSFTATNIAGSTTSSVVTITAGYQAPVFLGQPASQSVVEGLTARFLTYARGGPPPDYFLEHDDNYVALPITFEGCCGPGTGGFSLLDTTFADAGDYRIIASNFLGSATSIVATLTVTPAGPLDQWTQRNPLPQSQPIYSVAHGTNQFVAVGDRGTILTSSDGSNWALQNRRADVPLRGVAYGDGLFVAVGDGGTILSSSDGTNWAYRYTAASTPLNAVTHADGHFIAVGSAPGLSTLILHSVDGINWDRIPLGSYYAQQCVAYGNGVFIAGGANSILTSTDGTNWALAQSVSKQVESVTYADGHYVAVGDDGSILISTDGASWTPRLPLSTRRLLGVTYGAGRFVAAGARGTMVTSTDAIIWRLAPSGTPDRLETIDFAAGLFVAAGENGTIITSTNGTDWTKQNFGITRDFDGMFEANGMIAVVGKGGSILTTSDGVHYTEQDAGVTNDLHGITYGGGLWIAVGEPGIVLTSSNAVNWTSRDSGNTNSLKDATYANGQWIVVGTQGTIVRSTDGATWTSTFTSPPYDLNDVAYGNGLFLIAGDGPGNANGSLYSSSDGVTWSRVNFYPGKNLRGILFAEDQFVITANDSVLFTTQDALTFTPIYPFQYIANGRNLRAVTRAYGLWIVVGNFGTIITSPDLVTWTPRASRTFENQHQVTLLDGHLVVIGNRGGILQSSRFVSELEAPIFVPGAGVRVPFKAVLNRAYQFQTSTNLVDWTELLTFTNRAERSELTDTNALRSPQRFYRLLEP